MYNMVGTGQAVSEITPPACLPNLLPIATEWQASHWWDKIPPLGFYPVEFRQQWEYYRYVYVEVSDSVLEQYRFIGTPVPTKSGIRRNPHHDTMPGTDTGTRLQLERIVRADWLQASGDAITARAYRAYRTGATEVLSIAKDNGTEAVPSWPEDIPEPPTERREWYDAVPDAMQRHLLPIFDNCSGNTLPADFYQTTIRWQTGEHEYLYIDVPDSALASWALLGSLERDWRRGGCSLLDIQSIDAMPLDWGEAIAYRLYREPATGMLGIQPLFPNPDALICGQLVRALVDIPNPFWDKDAPESCDKFYARHGEMLVICKPGAEHETYSVERLDNGMPYFGCGKDVERKHLHVLEGQFRA